MLLAGKDTRDGMHRKTNGTESVRLRSHAESSSPPPTMSLPRPSSVMRDNTKIFDDAAITAGYESVPLLKIDTLPRGGISFETKGVGRVQVSLLTFDYVCACLCLC
jgi:hypothetical protein